MNRKIWQGNVVFARLIAISIFQKCLSPGCPASQMETLEEACEVHGIDVEDVVEKLNA